jgi:hypothetical protein
MGKKTIIARRKRINQASDRNETRRRCPWNINLRKLIEMKFKYIFVDSVGHSSLKGSINSYELNRK